LKGLGKRGQRSSRLRVPAHNVRFRISRGRRFCLHWKNYEQTRQALASLEKITCPICKKFFFEAEIAFAAKKETRMTTYEAKP